MASMVVSKALAKLSILLTKRWISARNDGFSGDFRVFSRRVEETLLVAVFFGDLPVDEAVFRTAFFREVLGRGGRFLAGAVFFSSFAMFETFVS